MTSRILTLTLFVPLLFAGCEYKPVFLAPTIGIKEVTYHPKYFCSGESILFTYRGENINKLQIHKSNGDLLIEMLGESGSGITAPMRAEWLPLSATGFSDFGKRGPESLEGKVVNIDSQTWAGSFWSREEIYQDAVERVHVSNVQEHDTASGEIVTVKVYEVYRTFLGFRWQIPAVDFGTRAQLLEIRNDGNLTLRFTLPGVTGQWQLAPGETATVPGRLYPGRAIEARYLSPEVRLIGKQKGEETKPENEHFEYTDLYEEREYPTSLSVICQSES